VPLGEEITLQGYKTGHNQVAPDNLKMPSLIKTKSCAAKVYRSISPALRFFNGNLPFVAVLRDNIPIGKYYVNIIWYIFQTKSRLNPQVID